MQKIDDITHLPDVGQTYLVPHVYGTLNVNRKSCGFNPTGWWPILNPHHEDSKYHKSRNGIPDPDAIHHYHTDPRFVDGDNFNSVDVTPNMVVEWRETVCVKSMPPIPALFYIFGPLFIEDHINSTIKCNMKCPHKGTYLGNVPIVDGIIKCPAHGLPFDARTKNCILTKKDTVDAEELQKRIMKA